MWRIAWKAYAILLGIYTFLRALFAAWNGEFVTEKAPWVEIFLRGLHFDSTAAAWVMTPVLMALLFRRPRVAGWFWLLLASLSFALEVTDVGYFPYTHRRSGPELLKILTFWKDTLPTLPKYVRDFAAGFLLFGFLVVLLAHLRKKVFAGPVERGRFEVAGWVGTLMLWGLVFRGGWQYKPLAVVDAAVNGCPSCSAFVLNTTFTMVRGLEQPPLPSWPDPPPGIPPYPRPLQPDTACAVAPRYNIVVLILESFSREYIEKGYAPFLKSLLQKGASVQWGFACNYRSAEGIPAILSSMPSWGEEPLLFTSYADRLAPGLGTYLQKWGYHTAFFHGGKNGTMLLDAYARIAGFSEYYGLNEYPTPQKDYDGSWGIWDEPFLQFTAEKINTFPEPFGVAIFTLSSHHPYAVPAALRDSFSGGPLPVYRSVQYADWALRRFFERVERLPWARRTLFVLTADHTGPSDEAYQSTRTFWVPIAFYIPGRMIPCVDSLGSHVDIVPTILEAIGYPYEVAGWGQSLWRLGPQRWVPMKPLPLYYEVLGREALLKYPLLDRPSAVAWAGMPWQQGATLDRLPDWAPEWESYLSSYEVYISPSMGRMRISSTTVPGGRWAMAQMRSATASPFTKRSGG